MHPATWLFIGGLMGIWSRTGASRAFADAMTRRFVRGPRSAKLVAWALGVVFFQGGSISTVLTGTTAKPVADRERVSHEELAYIVDSTASPIALLLAFNAWPLYVQTFIFVGGGPVERPVTPTVLHDAVLFSGDGRQRLRRPVLADFGHHGAQRHVHGLRPDGPRPHADSAGDAGGPAGRGVLDGRGAAGRIAPNVAYRNVGEVRIEK